MILVLVDDNSCLVSANSETQKKSCFGENLLGKQPSHFSLEGNCLRLFLACVWQLNLQRIFRNDKAFNNTFSIIFCLGAEDLRCNQ